MPYSVTKELLASFDSPQLKVAHGNVEVKVDPATNLDPYTLPKERNALIVIDHAKTDIQLSTDTVLSRIVQNRAAYEKRQRAKAEKAAREKEMEAKAKQ